MGYWVGQNINKVSIKPGRVPGLAGWWLRPCLTPKFYSLGLEYKQQNKKINDLEYKQRSTTSIIFNVTIPKLPVNKCFSIHFLFMKQVPMKGNLEIAIVFFITLREINDNN